MNTQKLFFICLLVMGSVIGFAQIPQHKSPLLLNVTSFSKHKLFQKKTEALNSSKAIMPMVVKKEEETTLFTQIMSWDCKIKMKLSNNMNFILTYN